ncbi:RNA 2',3'-cyclic phosphodiesterase [Halioglobus maricola]|uniref:RNA 2',3'-cyclic phosphodiesterase n=1 Tax=Halioglobus maricola TaxID=2601894 RepID=A0A5P9NGI8_9GAMM|nr:RNA 2',3'-cyclic phosphodiesterase [Halioglobus maricola]QFU74891.1 RNA 2',3'-cyclic phosphodiesterase [Halioglobus maricola]
MRLFFALEPSPEDARAIAEWRERYLPAQGRAVPAANFHITLAFLGEVSQQRLDRLCSAVDNTLDAGAPSTLELGLTEPGYWSKPRICWLGPDRWPRELDQLAHKLDQLGVAEGCKRNRGEYRPHITLYRGCDAPPPAPILAPDFELSLDHFALFESRQGRTGVSYEPVAAWELL